MLNSKTILITGGSGSFGRRFIEVVLQRYKPRKLIVFSRDEFKQFEMSQIFRRKSHDCIRYFVGDVRDKERLYRAFSGVDFVIHAAALKQVPAAEYNPFEAIKTNIFGAQNVIDAAIDQKVKRVIALSTDKAANPINLYGATKLCSDKLFIAGNSYVGANDTIFGVVRYGNVVGSRGSVIPFFMKQREKGVLTITDPRMTRFWITLEQGIEFVLKSLERMKGGELFIPKIPSLNIMDLARVIAPECETRIVGIRAGEKIHEIMIPREEARNTIEYGDHYIIQPQFEFLRHRFSNNGGKPVPDDFEYSSSTNTWWLTAEDMRLVLKESLGLKLENGTTAAKTILETTKMSSKGKTIGVRTSQHVGKPPRVFRDDSLVANHAETDGRKFIPYGRQWIDETDIAAVETVLRSDLITTGPKVEEFQEALCKKVGALHAVAVSSGTAALHAAMYAIGIGPGDEVIVPAMTFAATANSVVYQGGIPVFADVAPDTLLIDLEDVERKISPRTKAIIAVDYAGQPCEYDALRRLSERYNLVLVADACHSLGGSYRGEPVGSLAHLSTFSFHPVKHITTGEGGAVTTDNAEYASKMRIFRNHGITSDHHQRTQAGTFVYEMVDLGFNYRLTDFQCALGLSQLQKLTDWTKKRREIAEYYSAAFSNLPGLNPLSVKDDVVHAYHLYVVQIDSAVVGYTRSELVSELNKMKIGVNVHYIPVYLHPFYRNHFGTGPTLCPIAETAYNNVISLPIYPGMSPEVRQTVIETVEQLCSLHAGSA